MYELKLINEKNRELSFNDLGGQFTIVEISGLNPPKAQINTQDVALLAGSKYNSSKILMREIQLAFAVEYDAEEGRRNVYRVLQTGQPIRLTYKSDLFDLYVDGYVENIDPSYFAMKQVITVDILCPSPYFKGAQSIVNELSQVVSMFHFPFASVAAGELVFGKVDSLQSVSINNDGFIECGMTIELYARGSVSNPKIYNYVSGDFFGVTYALQAGDLVTITTEPGHKTVTLLREGVTTNLFNYVMEGSTWLQIPAEGGEFVYEVGSGDAKNLQVVFKHNDLYEGV